MLWPQKRRYVNDNFAHVLGRPPTSLEVRRKALAAYRSYARYVVELMRLPRMTNEQAAALVDTSTLLPLEAYWKASGKGLILTTAHIGNLEGVARGIARHGWPISSLATTRASRSCSSTSGRSAGTGASTSSRGATCATCTAC